MTRVTADNSLISGSGPITVADLAELPDDGRRYELLDGVLIVSPAPGTRHQAITYRLYGVLEAACPAELAVLGAPYAVHVGENTELQPDLLIGRLADFTATDLPAAPVLVVEVASPSTALIDRNTKKAAYARMGVAHYWIIEPAGPRLTAYRSADGEYHEVATAIGAETFTATTPFPVRFVPRDLLGPFANC
ncbi:Uma2 family endonuclease [Skermania piniformis]|uniref:Uma2 family endonuclease n=1 Tax=Skermania pinensis TaxID=39122 RepID=A0ABX8S7Z5_9ACTN|nr:Uma2 family endonuclease [Skermania piniformis]QXQ13958.1 Uma2 family endonuclease [Skermania piniformis]